MKMKEELRTETISVKVTPSDKEAGRIKSAKEGMTLSSKISDLLKRYIKGK